MTASNRTCNSSLKRATEVSQQITASNRTWHTSNYSLARATEVGQQITASNRTWHTSNSSLKRATEVSQQITASNQTGCTSNYSLAWATEVGQQITASNRTSYEQQLAETDDRCQPTNNSQVSARSKMHANRDVLHGVKHEGVVSKKKG